MPRPARPRLAWLGLPLVAALLGALPWTRADDPPPAANETAAIERDLSQADEDLKARKLDEAAARCKAALDAIKASSLPAAEKRRLGQHALYDGACALALSGKPELREKAVEAVRDAIELGYVYFEHLEKDPWLESLRGLESWQKLLAQAKASHAAKASPAPSPAAGSPAGSAPAGSAPAADSLEWVSDELYRAPEGQATVALPDLGLEWTSQPQAGGGVVFFLGKPNAWQARISFWVYPRERFANGAEADAALAAKIARGVAGDMRRTNPWLTSNPDLAGEARALPTGSLDLVTIEGTEPPKRDFVATVAGLARGKVGAEATLFALAADRKRGLAALEKLVQRVRLGDAVPRLPKHDPGTPIEGVFLGPYEIQGTGGTQHWYVFERRGYATDEAPGSEQELDLEMLYQSGSRSVYSYTVQANKLVLTPLLGGKPEEVSLKIDGRRLEIDGRRYDRVDGGHTDGLRLQGNYATLGTHSVSSSAFQQFSFHSSSSYSFGADGTFRSASVASATLSSGTGDPRVNAAATAADHGTYAVKGDRIVFTYANGARIVRTIYPCELKVGPPVSFSRELVYIGGSNFLRER